MAGPGGVSKSTLALQVALSIRAGRDIWHLWSDGAAVPDGDVLILSLEDDEQVVHNKLVDLLTVSAA